MTSRAPAPRRGPHPWGAIVDPDPLWLLLGACALLAVLVLASRED